MMEQIMLSQEELDQLLGGEQSGGGDESLDQNDLDDMFSSPGEEESTEEEDENMSQDDLDALMGGGGDAGDEEDSDDDANMSQDDLDALMGGGGDADEGGEGEEDIDWGAAFAEAAAGGDSAAAEAITTGQSSMAEEDDEEYEEEEEEDSQPFIPEDLDIPHIHFILELPLELTVEIGRTVMNIKTLLQQNQGSVIELNKDADEPVEIYVGKKLMATGEVVVVDDNFGVRIEDVASQADRIRSLGSPE
jgi:flagellar motor switch protein FliN/FliY